jgi:hypothetical protein
VIPASVQVELDKLTVEVRALKNSKRAAATEDYVDRKLKALRDEIKMELDALKRRAG